MNKAELIESIANSTLVSKANVAKVLDATTGSIIDTLKKGDSVILIGFGTFSVRDRAARIGRNPRTGEELKIKAAKVPGFKPGKAFKDAVK